MNGDTNSDETTASSGPSHGFVCTICFKVFPSGQALGGHQNAHLVERSFRQGTPNILGAVLNHPLPPELDVDVDDLPLIGSNPGHGHGHRPAPTKLRSDLAVKGNGSNKIIKRIRSGDNKADANGSNTRKCGSSHHYHPYERVGDGEESRRNHLTRNLLGEWKPLMQQFKDDGLEKGAIDVDLELSLKGKEYMNLDLKLGF